MKAFFAAFQFLTILPFVHRIVVSDKDLQRSVIFFPFVGLILGLIAYGFAFVVSGFLPPLACCVLTVLFLIALSGGLHLDGLADTMDGFYGSRSKEKILIIMRDSRIGTMGALAIVAIVLIKVAFLLSIYDPFRLAAIFLVPIAGRFSLLVTMLVLEYVREEGTAHIFSKNKQDTFLGFALGLLLFVAASLIVCGIIGVLIVGVSLLMSLFLSIYSKRKINGYTGDTLGATCEIVETVPAIVLAVMVGTT